MKANFIVVMGTIALLLLSCKKENSPAELLIKKDSVTVVEPEIHKDWYGIYSGDFETEYDPNSTSEETYVVKKLSLKVNKITKDSVYGYSIVNGNQRTFRGYYDDRAQRFFLDESGDDKTDGRFEVVLRKDSLVGRWKAFNTKAVKSPNKTVKLIKKEFAYNPNFMLDRDQSDIVDWTTTKMGKSSYEDEEGHNVSFDVETQRYASDAIFTVNGSKQKLVEKDLKNLKKLDMEIIKNAIFARHGYSFKKETYRQFFNTQDWYVPVSNQVDDALTPLEKENIVLLERFIKYAEDNYDNFGR